MARWRTFMEKYSSPGQAAGDGSGAPRVALSGGSGSMGVARSPISQYFR